MSVSDVAARMQQLQSQFALMAGPPASAGATATVDGTGSFAQALSKASSATATSSARELSGVGTPTAAGGASESAVVSEARKYLGIPYLWGGTDPKKGLDCSGFVQLVYKNLGIDLPRVSYQQATEGRSVPSMAQARPGDLLAFGKPTVGHIAIYLGDNKMIEAPRPGTQVRVSEVYETPVAIRRILPEGGSVPAARAASGSGDLPGGVPFSGLFEKAGAKYGVPATLLAAVAKQESAYNPSAVSPAGARGLMQIMPATARGLGVDPMQPAQAVDGAARLLRDLIGRFGRVDEALAAYNAGPGAVIRYGGIPPYPETQRYVPAVLRFQRELEAA